MPIVIPNATPAPKPLTEIYNHVKAIAEACPEIIITQQAQHTIVDFCERSLCLKKEEVVNLYSGVSEYTVDAGVGFQVVKVVDLYVNEKKIDPTSVEDLDQNITDWRTKTGTAIGYIHNSHEDIRIIYIPDQTIVDGLRFRFAYRPDYSATEFPDMIFERWFEGILAGVKSRILAITNKPWSDPAGADFYRGVFENAIGAASAMGAKQFGVAKLRVTPCP
jgi:hypothetical protein